MKNVTLTIRGSRPLLHHNVRLVDPLNPFTQALSRAATVAKSKKTEEAHRALRDAEFAGGLYHDDEIGPYVKAESVERCLRDGAATGFRGLGAKVARGVLVTSTDGHDLIPLLYKGPRDIASLIDDPNFRHVGAVKVGQQRVMRTRPRFADWTLECLVMLDESQLSKDQLADIASYAGLYMGLGDNRPRYGRFEATLS